MSQISLKSISGITSITTPAGVDNVFTVHTDDTTERFRIDQTGNQNISGIITATNFKTGSSNLHSAGVEVAGVNVLGANTPIGAGATIFNSGVVVSKAGAEFQGIVTASNFKKTDGSDVGAATQVTIGMRAGAAVTFSATGSSFNVVGRGGNIPISI